MSRRAATILKRLAAAGRPQMWATEPEAAALSGMEFEVYCSKIKYMEQRGFPPVNPENGLRSIPAILAFWGLSAKDALAAASESARDDESKLENWPSGPTKKTVRLASTR